MTRLTRGAASATLSTQALIRAMTSSHSPSTLVNMALVSLGSPLIRTRRTASATLALTDSPVPNGVMEKAASMPDCRTARRAAGLLGSGERGSEPFGLGPHGRGGRRDPVLDHAAQPLPPADLARPGDGQTPGVVEDDAPDPAGHLALDDLGGTA